MDDTETRHKALLMAVNAFSPVSRYGGMMPRHLVCAWGEENIKDAEHAALICHDVCVNDNGFEIRGERLTKNGAAALRDLVEH